MYSFGSTYYETKRSTLSHKLICHFRNTNLLCLRFEEAFEITTTVEKLQAAAKPIPRRKYDFAIGPVRPSFQKRFRSEAWVFLS